MMRIRAFSIIELIVSIALATVLITTAYSAFRVASGYVSAGNRMANENALMVSGYFLAVDEADFMRAAASDPDRAPAFEPLDEAVVNLVDNAPAEDWWHWRDHRNPDPHRPWGILGEEERSWADPWDGDPRLTDAHKAGLPDVTPAENGHFYDPDPGDGREVRYTYPGMSDAQALAVYRESHGFYERTKVRERIHGALGWYAYAEYVPPNALFASEEEPDPDFDGFDEYGRDEVQDGKTFLGHDFNCWLDMGGATFFNSGSYSWYQEGGYPYLMLDPYGRDTLDQPGHRRSPSLAFAAETQPDLRSYIDSLDGVDMRGWDAQKPLMFLDLMNRSFSYRGYDNELLGERRPASWPNLRVMIRRRVAAGERQTIAVINALSPATGEQLGFRFRIWGTTLRGARINMGIEDPVSYDVK